jgi:lambda repressor-like predicted transcriptional regulator
MTPTRTARAIELRRQGQTLQHIAQELHVSHSTIWQAHTPLWIPLPHHSRKWTPAQALPLYQRYKGGTSLSVLARELGCSRQNLHEIFQRYGLCLRRYTSMTPPKTARAIQLQREGRTLTQIAQALQVHFSTVRSALLRAGQHQPRRRGRSSLSTQANLQKP